MSTITSSYKQKCISVLVLVLVEDMGPWYSQMTGYFGVVASPLPWAFWSSRVGCCYLWSPETPTLDCWNSVLGLPLPSAGVDAWLSFGRVASHLQLSWVPWMAGSPGPFTICLWLSGGGIIGVSHPHFSNTFCDKNTQRHSYSLSLSLIHTLTLSLFCLFGAVHHLGVLCCRSSS